MKGRRTAAMLCVLLGHALAIHMLMTTRTGDRARAADAEDAFVGQLIMVFEPDDPPADELVTPPAGASITRLESPSMSPDALAGAPAEPVAGESGATISGYVDWPREGKEAAARVLAREAESQRVAKLFAGPQGTWASLTKRQQSELSKFRWKPGVDGLERDAKGNTVYQFKNGCTLVNFQFIGCPIGAKQPAYGDLFKDMRRYFDEQRLPRTDEGNGREPESLRPPKWQKPLE